MITVRLTNKKAKQALLHYGGLIDGIYALLIDGGIDIKKPYTNTLDRETGDSIYTQDEPEVIEEEMPKKSKKKSRKKRILHQHKGKK